MTFKLRFLGFVSLDGSHPGFRYPVFGSGFSTGVYKIQSISESDSVIEFVPAKLTAKVIETYPAVPQLEAFPGGPAHFAFAFDKQEIVVGDRSVVAEALRARWDAFQNSSALTRYQIARFVGHSDHGPRSISIPEDRPLDDDGRGRVLVGDGGRSGLQERVADVPPAVFLSAEMIDGAAAAARIGDHAPMGAVETEPVRRIRELSADHGGHVLEVEPDRILTSFRTAHDAGECAIRIQRGIAEDRDRAGSGLRLRCRIGISAASRGDRESVITASQIGSIAPPGGICMSHTVYMDVQDNAWARAAKWEVIRLQSDREPVRLFTVNSASNDPLRRSFSHTRSPRRPIGAVRMDAPSIGVLPFRNQTHASDDNLFCDGISDDVVTALSRFPELVVGARRTRPEVRDGEASLRDVGGDLGVRYLLTGCLRRADSKVCVDVQLVCVASDSVVWAMRHEGTTDDVFQFQDDVANAVAGQIAVRLRAAERHRAMSQKLEDLSPHGLVQRGEQVLQRFTSLANQHARNLFEQAAIREPAYARPYVGLARTFNLDWRYGWVDDRQAALETALELSDRAIQNDQTDPRGYAERGFSLLYQWKHDSAFAAYERALDLNPNDADVLVEFANLHAYTRRADKAVDLIKRAMRLNPYYPDHYPWALGAAYFVLRDYESAVRWLLKMQDLSEAHRLLCACYAHLDRMEEARHYAERIRTKHPNLSIAHWRTVPPNQNQEDIERFIAGLRKAGLT